MYYKREDWRGYRNTSPISTTVLIAQLNSVKEQDRLKSYLSEKCGTEIKVVRENGMSTYKSHPEKAYKVKHYIFDHYDSINKEFKFKSFEFDMTKDF